MWNAICYSAEYKQKFSSLELCQQLPLRFSRFPGDISTPSHIKVNQGSQTKTIFKNNNNNKKDLLANVWTCLFSQACVYLSVCTVRGERLLHLIKGEPLSCPQTPKRHGPTGKMVITSHGIVAGWGIGSSSTAVFRSSCDDARAGPKRLRFSAWLQYTIR